MQQFKPLLFALGACSIISCDDSREQMPTGYEFTFHLQHEDSSKPKEGDKVYFHVDMYHSDDLIESSRTKAKPASLTIRPKVQGIRFSPMEQALSLMAVGDSMSLFTQIDTLYPTYAFKDDQKELEYRLKMLAIEGVEETENHATASK